MTAAYFEDHPTDPDKVILRKPYSTACPNCEYHRKRAQLWRDEAYKQAGHPLPEREDDHALIDAGLLNSDLGMLRTIPSFTQLQQIIKNLEHCLSRDSKQEFLRVWIRDWTEHKLSQNTTPPQRTWVGLTEKDICEAAVKSQEGISPRDDTLRFARAIEAKLRSKND